MGRFMNSLDTEKVAEPEMSGAWAKELLRKSESGATLRSRRNLGTLFPWSKAILVEGSRLRQPKSAPYSPTSVSNLLKLLCKII